MGDSANQQSQPMPNQHVAGVTQPTPGQVTQDPNLHGQKIPEPERPISLPNKESGPGMIATEAPPSEVIQLTETTPEVAPELQEIGMEAVAPQEHPHIADDVKQAGVEPAKDAVPVPVEPSGMVQLPALPMDEVKAAHAIKTHAVDDAIRWLATLTQLIIGKAKKEHSNASK